MQNPAAYKQFPIVSYGGTRKEALLHKLRDSGIQLNQLALTLFADLRFTTSAVPAEVEVAEVSVASLGFLAGATFEQLVARAAGAGLGLCLLELGPHLRLALPDQPEGVIGRLATQDRAPHGAITVASLPMDRREELPKGFYCRRIEGTPWLRGYRSWSGHLWSPEDVFAFIRSA